MSDEHRFPRSESLHDLAAGVRHARDVLAVRFHMWAPHLDALTEEAARLDANTNEPPGNVTRIHPAPSIPNPLHENPWAALTDEELSAEITRVHVRIDAIEHTKKSLIRELARRAGERARS